MTTAIETEQITHVSVKVGSGYDLLTKVEWLEMPVPERVQLILQNKVQFLNGEEIIPARAALKLLKAG